jgi:tight adherence protein C
MLNILYPAIIFLVVTLVMMGILVPMVSDRSKKRLGAVVEDTGYSANKQHTDWGERVMQLAAPLAKLSLPTEGWEQSPLRMRFIHAGYRGTGPIALYFGAKTGLALLFPAVVYLYLILSGAKIDGTSQLLILLIAASIGYYLSNIVLSRLVFLRQREIFEAFPDAADLLLVCVESGLGMDAALVKVTEEIRTRSEVVSEEFHLVNLELRAGNSRDKALRNLALRTGVDEVNTFVTMLLQADRFGTSIGESLRVFSDDLRTKRRLRAEELAAKIPLKMLFPLVFCIFPSLLCVLLGPAFIQVYRILIPTMAGH